MKASKLKKEPKGFKPVQHPSDSTRNKVEAYERGRDTGYEEGYRNGVQQATNNAKAQANQAERRAFKDLANVWGQVADQAKQASEHATTSAKYASILAEMNAAVGQIQE